MNSFVYYHEDNHWAIELALERVDFEKRFINITDNYDLIEIN